MAIIDPDSPVINESSTTFWEDELINLKIILNKVNEGILYLQKYKHQSYMLDSGQTNQRVQRLNLAELENMRRGLLSDIRDLELKNGVGTPGVKIVKPCW